MRASTEFRRDLRALRRHLWLLIVLLTVSLAAAAASLILVPRSDEATFRTRLALSALPPLFGPETLPTMDDFARLAISPEALEATSEALRAEGIDQPADALAPRLSAQPRNKQNSIDFKVDAGDADLSLTIARAWSKVFAAMAPAGAAALESEATNSYRVQLERAQEELDQKRQAVADLGVTVLPGAAESATEAQVSAATAAYEAKSQALAAEEVERSEIGNILAQLRPAVSGATLSSDQLRLLLAGILPAEALTGDLTAAAAVSGLEMRAAALDSTIASLKRDIGLLGLALDERSPQLEQAMTELDAAEDNYLIASRLAQSYAVVGDTLQVDVSFPRAPQRKTNGALDWAARFGAAAAFAVVVGVLSALALEALSGGRRAPSPAAPARPVPPPLSRSPAPPLRSTLLRDSGPSPGGRRRWNRPVQFGATAIAAVLLMGILGTLARRQRPLRRLRRRVP